MTGWWTGIWSSWRAGAAEHAAGGGFDLKAFFTVIPKDPVAVTAADVFEFLAHQRGDRTVVRLARPGHQRVARRRRHLVAPGIGAHPGLVGRADHGARPAVGLDAAAGHREASGLGAILLTLALSFAAQNAVTALRLQAGPPLAPGQPTGQRLAPP